MKQVQKTKQKVKDDAAKAREAKDNLIGCVTAVLKKHGPCTRIEMRERGGVTADSSTLAAALRVARHDGRVLFDGKRYSLPASAPATTPEPPAFSEDGPLTRVDEEAPVTPTMPSPRAATIVPPAPLPAWVKDGQRVKERLGSRAGTLARSSMRSDVWLIEGSGLSSACHVDVLEERWVPVFDNTGKPTLPAWLREGQRVRGIGQRAGLEGVLHDMGFAWRVEGAQWTIGKGCLDTIERDWAPVYAPQPAPGFARDLAERQAFGFTTARERIASVLTRAGLTEATAAQPGVLVRVERDGRIGLRWGVKHADGSTASCAWTEHAERLLERASNALHNAGYKASVGAPEERAPKPSEAAEFAALEAELAATRAERDDAVEREVAAETRRAFAEKHLDRAMRILEIVAERRHS